MKSILALIALGTLFVCKLASANNPYHLQILERLRGRVGGEATQRTRARELGAEEDGCGAGAGYPDAEGRKQPKMVSLAERRRCVSYLRERYTVNERRACQAMEMNRSSYRYAGTKAVVDGVYQRVVALSHQYPCWGYANSTSAHLREFRCTAKGLRISRHTIPFPLETIWFFCPNFFGISVTAGGILFFQADHSRSP